jgi:hypothetical protein
MEYGMTKATEGVYDFLGGSTDRWLGRWLSEHAKKFERDPSKNALWGLGDVAGSVMAAGPIPESRLVAGAEGLIGSATRASPSLAELAAWITHPFATFGFRNTGLYGPTMRAAQRGANAAAPIVGKLGGAAAAVGEKAVEGAALRGLDAWENRSAHEDQAEKSR